jgi:hypothetical protein
MSAGIDEAAMTKASASLVVCQLANGSEIVTTLAACEGTPGARVVGKGGGGAGSTTTAAETLVAYRLPSGNQVVGTYVDFLTDNGRDFDEADARQIQPNGNGSELFLCRLPSGTGIIATFDECKLDGGTVVGKLPERTKKHYD